MNKIIDTGTMIKTYLDANNKTLVELANSSNVSVKTIYRILNNETKLSYKVAEGINKLIPEIDIDFLMSYDAKYLVQIKENEKKYGINNLVKLIDKFQLKELYPELSYDKNALIEKGLAIFKENFNCNNNNSFYIESVNFNEANNAKKDVEYAWLKASQYEYYLLENIFAFNTDVFNKMYPQIIDYCGTTNKEITLYNMREIARMCGINFYFRKSIPNCRIMAATFNDENDNTYIFMSDLFKCIEGMWISFIHELTHIKNGDNEKKYKQNEVREDNEENTIEETVFYFIKKGYDDIKECTIQTVLDIANKNNIPKGIAAYFIRNKTKVYNNASVNDFLHYYK